MSQPINPISGLDEAFLLQYNNLFKVAFKLCGDQQLAEDIIQETYIKARVGWNSFKGESSVSTWLYRITVNCSYQFIKKIKKLPVQMLSQQKGITEQDVYNTLPRSNKVEEELLAEDLREKCLTGFIKCLPTKQRIAFTLKVILGLKTSEVADIMKTSPANIKVLVHRARKHLKNLMENRCSLIKIHNPCQCEIWVAWALENGIINKDKKHNLQTGAKNILPGFWEELSILHKIYWLHQQQPAKSMNFSTFKKRVQNLINEKKLKILS